MYVCIFLPKVFILMYMYMYIYVSYFISFQIHTVTFKILLFTIVGDIVFITFNVTITLNDLF